MLTHPDKIGPIVRRDESYVDTEQDRIGGSSYSSGVFLEEATGQLWLGKAELLVEVDEQGEVVYDGRGRYVIDEARAEANACGEKLASDIYAYYGVITPQIELSRQRMTNPQDPEDIIRPYTIHVMSELL